MKIRITTQLLFLLLVLISCNNKVEKDSVISKAAIQAEIDKILAVQEGAYNHQSEESRTKFAATCDDSLFFVSGDEGGLSTTTDFYTHDWADGYSKMPYDKQYKISNNTVIVTFLTQTFKVFNKDSIFFNTRGTKVFTNDNGKWKMNFVTYAPLPVTYFQKKMVNAVILNEYAGSYREDAATTDVVSVEDGKLFLSTNGSPKSELLALSDSGFYSKGYFGKTGFVRNAQGQVTHSYFEFTDGQRLVFPRIN